MPEQLRLFEMVSIRGKLFFYDHVLLEEIENYYTYWQASKAQ